MVNHGCKLTFPTPRKRDQDADLKYKGSAPPPASRSSASRRVKLMQLNRVFCVHASICAHKKKVQTFYNLLQSKHTSAIIKTPGQQDTAATNKHNTKKKRVKVRSGIITIIDATNYCHNSFLAKETSRPAWHHARDYFFHPTIPFVPYTHQKIHCCTPPEGATTNKQTYQKKKEKKKKKEFNALLSHGPFYCKRINCLQRPASGPALLFNPGVADISTANKPPCSHWSSNQKHITPKGPDIQTRD